MKSSRSMSNGVGYFIDFASVATPSTTHVAALTDATGKSSSNHNHSQKMLVVVILFI
jgi:hypothetical protein